MFDRNCLSVSVIRSGVVLTKGMKTKRISTKTSRNCTDLETFCMQWVLTKNLFFWTFYLPKKYTKKGGENSEA